MEKTRESGVLLHISSLPGEYGIGDFGKNAYKFVDFLKETKTKNWQILPLGITGYGDSPYQSFSAFAGNPYFIDLDEFITEGFLSKEDIKNCDLGQNEEKVDFGLLYENKMPLLKKAFNNSRDKIKHSLKAFYEEEREWLKDFALFMAIKGMYKGDPWKDWSEGLKLRDKSALEDFFVNHRSEVEFWIFTQYYFFKQWQKLKEYANDNGIKIIGDIPIYVAEDGSDIWANPKMFKLNPDLTLKHKAGCPPDAFSADGQLWGNPIYNWDYIKENDYSWWIKRIKESFRLYDKVRIDHFRGFESYWSIDGDSDSAKNGDWVKGPGMDLFNKVKEELGELNILAEDLGFLTKDVEKLIEDTGFPGMKVLVFAFDSREDSDYLPHNYDKNSVVYTGNHDTETVKGYLDKAPIEEVNYAMDYIGTSDIDEVPYGFLRLAFASPSLLCVVPMQDLLELGNEARFNIPSTLGNNWVWRLKKDAINEEVKDKLLALNTIYRR